MCSVLNFAANRAAFVTCPLGQNWHVNASLSTDRPPQRSGISDSCHGKTLKTQERLFGNFGLLSPENKRYAPET